MQLLKLDNISKTYQMGGVSVHALKNINLQINVGELTAIIGPSGSGKSTLMHIIGCLDRPSKGEYFFDKKPVSQLTDEELAKIRNQKIGFIFQTFNLLPRTSALANVELPLVYGRISFKKRRQTAIKKLKEVGLGDRLSHWSNQLSGGQQQRVAIARALVNSPQLILADEPTGNLDSKSGREIMEILKKLNKQSHTIIVVTHDQEIAQHCPRIINLKDGQISSDN